MSTHKIEVKLNLNSESLAYQKALSMVNETEEKTAETEHKTDILLQNTLSELLEDLLLERLSTTPKKVFSYSREEVKRVLDECVLTTSEAGDKLGLSPQAVHSLVYRRKLTPIKSSSGGYLFYAGDIEQILADKKPNIRPTDKI